MEPRATIDPANATVGDRLQARDAPEPYWYDAAVIAKPSRTSVTVRFKNFSSKHDKTLKRADKALRVPVTAAELKAERAALERTCRYGGDVERGLLYDSTPPSRLRAEAGRCALASAPLGGGDGTG